MRMQDVDQLRWLVDQSMPVRGRQPTQTRAFARMQHARPGKGGPAGITVVGQDDAWSKSLPSTLRHQSLQNMPTQPELNRLVPTQHTLLSRGQLQ